MPKTDARSSAVDGILISAGPTFGEYTQRGLRVNGRECPLKGECPFQVSIFLYFMEKKSHYIGMISR